MSDEQTAKRIVEDALNTVCETSMEAAIVKALHDARTPPPGHIIDDQGVVRRVLGSLPITADGCVVGETASPAFWFDGTILHEGMMGCDPKAVFAYPNVPAMLFSLNDGVKPCYSTRDAAQAAKEAKQ